MRFDVKWPKNSRGFRTMAIKPRSETPFFWVVSLARPSPRLAVGERKMDVSKPERGARPLDHQGSSHRALSLTKQNSSSLDTRTASHDGGIGGRTPLMPGKRCRRPSCCGECGSAKRRVVANPRGDREPGLYSVVKMPGWMMRCPLRLERV